VLDWVFTWIFGRNGQLSFYFPIFWSVDVFKLNLFNANGLQGSQTPSKGIERTKGGCKKEKSAKINNFKKIIYLSITNKIFIK